MTGAISFADDALPFSFVYAGIPSALLLSGWRRVVEDHAEPGLTRTTITWAEPAPVPGGGRLRVRCEIVDYHDFPTVDWTVWFANAGTGDTPPITRVLALDTWVHRAPEQRYVVHSIGGSTARDEDYRPYEVEVEPADSWRLFASTGGRATNGTIATDLTSPLVRGGFPYLNVDLTDGTGFVVSLGWPGQWMVQLRREGSATGMHLVGGMTSRPADAWNASDGPGTSTVDGDGLDRAGLLDTVLRPGEEIRTPRVVWQTWRGEDWVAGQNVWRRWMLAHNTPRVAGALPGPVLSCMRGGDLIDTCEDQLSSLAAFVAHGATAGTGGPHDYWWRDAGWYDTRPDCSGDDDGWNRTGTWVPSPGRYPGGLTPLTDAVRAAGMQAILWYEPERVRAQTWLARMHPEWLLHDDAWPDSASPHAIVDLGNPEAWQWTLDTLDGLIASTGTDLYRQDFNTDPLPFWNAADESGRAGMRQVRHVMGYLALWDELRRRHPAMLIDTCASGGRRNDLETLCRALPLLRSDRAFEPVSQQCHNYGISLWFPIHGTQSGPRVLGNGPAGYAMRSAFSPAYATTLDEDDPLQWTDLARLVDEWTHLAPLLTADYHPLTAYSLAPDVWQALQYHDPDGGEGVLLVYRRAGNGQPSLTFALQDIEPTDRYEVHDGATGIRRELSGAELANLTVALEPAAATTVRYARVVSYPRLVADAKPVCWWLRDTDGDEPTGAGADLGNAPELCVEAGTVEAWVRTTAVSGTAAQTVAAKPGAYGISLYQGHPHVTDWSTLEEFFGGGDTFVADGQWHHVVLTFRSGVTNGTRVFVDGRRRMVATTTVDSQDQPLSVGTGVAGANFDGTIDIVAVYPVVLTASQLERRHRLGLQMLEGDSLW